MIKITSIMYRKALSFFWLLLFCSNLFGQENSTGVQIETIPIYTLNDGSISVPISMSYNGSGVLVGSIPTSIGQNWSLNAGGQITRQVRSKPDEMDENPKTGTFLGQLFNDITPSDATSSNLAQKDTEKDIFVLSLNELNVPFVLGTKNLNYIDCYKYYDNIILLNKNVDIKIEFLQYTSGCELYNPIPDNIVVRGSENTNPSVQSNLDIVLSKSGIINHFRVTTSNGIQYYFGTTVESKEYGLSYQSYLDQDQLCTLDGKSFFTSPINWKLTKIVYPKGVSGILGGPNKPDSKYQEVNFTYKRTQSLHKNIVTEKPFTIYSTECIPVQRTETDPKKMPLGLNSELKRIESDNFVIDFNSDYIFSLSNSLSNTGIIEGFTGPGFTSKKRVDIPAMIDYPNLMDDNLPCLESVNGQTTQINNPFKNEILMPKAEILKNILITDKISQKKLAFYFHHDYLSGYKYNKNSNSRSTTNGRLVLKGFYQINLGENNRIMPGYKFLYNTIPLPDYDSFAKDHWGYYNGQDQNENKTGLIEIPSNQVLDGLGLSTFTCSVVKSDLNVNESFSQAGVLTNLKLPSGAEIIYSYENHSSENYFEYAENVNGTIFKRNIRKIGGLRIKRITRFEPFKKEYFYKEYKYEKEGGNQSSGILNIWPAYIFTYSNPSIPEYSNPGYGVVIPNHTSQISDRFIYGSYIYYSRIKTYDYILDNNIEISLGYSVAEFFDDQSSFLIKRYQLFNGNSWENDNGNNEGYTYAGIRDSYSKPFSNPLNGNLIKKQIFNSSNILLNEETYSYSTPELQSTINQLYFSAPYKLGYHPLIHLPGSCSEVPLTAETVRSISNPIAQIALNQIGLPIAKALVKRAIVNYFAKYATERALSQSISIVNPISIAAQVITLAVNSIAEPIDCSSYLNNPNTIDYQLPIHDIKLINTTTKIFDFNGMNEKVSYQTFNYDLLKRYSSPKSIQTTFSTSSDIILEETVMSNDFDLTNYENSNDENIVAIRNIKKMNMILPIEKVKKKNNKIIAGNFLEYSSELGKEGVLKKEYQLELEAPLSNFPLTNISNGEFFKSDFYVPYKEYISLNSKGLLSSYRSLSKNGSEIIGLPKINLYYGNNDLILNHIEKEGLGTQTRSTYNQSIPLFGVTELMNPDGQKQINQYDDLGRLIFEKDKDLNLIKSYLYNEKQPSPIAAFSFLLESESDFIININDGDIISKSLFSTVSSINIKATLPSQAKSFEFRINGTEYSDFQTGLIDSESNEINIYLSQLLTSYTEKMLFIEVKAYSESGRIGEVVGYSKLNFTVQNPPSQLRTLNPKK